MDISSKPPDSQGTNRISHRNVLGIQGVQKLGCTDRINRADRSRSATEDRMNSSGRSGAIADIKARVNRLPEVREERIREIKLRVEEGTYTVDPLKVAEAILKNIRPL